MERSVKSRGTHAAGRKGVSAPAVLGAAGMAACLAVGAQALAIEGLPTDVGDAATEPVEQPAAASSSYARGAAEPAQVKSETVRIQASADGTPEAATVKAELTGNGADMLLDRSNVRGITGVEGASDYSVNGQEIIWAADGDTVSYAGTTTEEAPVRVGIVYELDGNPIAPAELAGKSGHVKISVSYTNASRMATVDVNEKNAEVSTPFVCATLFTVDPDKFANVEVEGGKVLEIAGSTVVAGFGLPGFADSLGVDLDELGGDSGLEIDLNPDLGQEFTVEADVTDFALAQTMTIATCQPFAEIDADSLDTSSLDGMLSTLQSSMDALANGSGALANGLDKLLSGARTLESGAAALSEGASTLAQGAQKLDNSASALPDATGKLAEGSAALADGVSSLSSGLSTMDEKTSTLPSGTSKLLEGARSLEAGATSLDKGASSLAAAFGTSDDTTADRTLIGLANSANAAAGQVESGVGGLMDAMVSASALSSQIGALADSLDDVPDTSAITAAATKVQSASASLDGAESAIVIAQGYAGSAEDALSSIDLAKLKESDPDAAAAVNQALAQLSSAGGSMSEAESAVSSAREDAGEAADMLQSADIGDVSALQSSLRQGASSLAAPSEDGSAAAQIAQLQALAQQLHRGLGTLVSALQIASEGAGSLSAGASSLHAGATSLAEGTKTLDSSATALVDGVDALAEGAGSAASGARSVSQGNAALAESSGKLAESISSLASGASSLEEGAGKLASGTPALTQGLESAHDGSVTLASGLSQFNEQAIGRITSLLGDNVDSASARLQAMVELAGQYDTFTGKTDRTEGSVMFIIQTTGIGE